MMLKHSCGRTWGRPFTARKDLVARRLLCRQTNRSVHVRSADDRELEVAKLKGDIAEANGRIVALYEAGGQVPRAGQIAAMRQEVSKLQAKLEELEGTRRLADEKLAQHARQAFLEVERLVSQERGSTTESHDGPDIVLLEAENERLRLVATALLHRQSQLEELAEKHGLLPLVLSKPNGAGDFTSAR